MSNRKGNTSAGEEQSILEPLVVHGSHATLCQCLVVSADPVRRDLFEHAAIDTGWKAIVCGDVEAALAHVQRSIVQLATVDLREANGQELAGGRALVEQLALDRELLLVVCGGEADAPEEIWARRLGAWLYLPGVTPDCDLATLCGEARQIAQQLHRAWPWSESVSTDRPTSKV